MVDIWTRIEKEYKVNLNHFLELYNKGLGREEIAEQLGTSVFRVRQIASLLGLRMKKKHRQHDYELLLTKLKADTGNIDVIEDLIKDLDLANKELLKMHKSLVNCRDQNNLLRKQVRELAREENIYERLKADLQFTLEEIDIIAHQFEHKPIITQNNTLIVTLADLHIGQLVEAEDVGGANEYNFEIAKQRILKVFEEANRIGGKRLEVVILGDPIAGIIHGGNIIGEMPAVKALVSLIKLLSEILIPLSLNFQKINVTITNSNHSRLTEQPTKYKKAYDFDYIFSEFLQELLKDYNINVEYSLSGYNLIQLSENKYGFAFHGDTIRNYDITKEASVLKVMELCRQHYGVEPHLILNGHFHTYTSVLLPNGGMAISVGTLMGTDSYSYTSGYTPMPPSQVIINCDENGNIEWHKVVVLDKVGRT